MAGSTQVNASGEMQVDVLSPARILARTKATQVMAPGAMGYMGILPGHAAMVAELGTGELVISGSESGAGTKFFVAGGYAEVVANKVTLLVDVVEKQGEIDVERAKRSQSRANERLASRKGDVDYARAQASLLRATGRISFAAGR